MNERVKPDFSVNLQLGEESVLVNRVYDNVHLFNWIGHSILKIIGRDGFLQWHTTYENGVRVANAAGITPVHREEISQHEYEQYLLFQEQMLDDGWLNGIDNE